MSHWKNSTINLGIIKAGTPKKVTFIALPDMPTIESIKPYCGCTTSQYDKEKGLLTITYSNRTIPMQVKGMQTINKRIDILYVNGLTEVLTIQAIRTR
jgi:hypothetical protein